MCLVFLVGLAMSRCRNQNWKLCERDLLAWGLGIRQLIRNFDSKLAMELVLTGVDGYHKFAALVEDLGLLLARTWVVRVAHTLREGNFCAYGMVKKGAC